MRIWIQGTRPKTWIASISPVIIGTLLAPKPDPFVFAITLFCALFIQMGTNLANDYYDCIQGKDTDLRKGPKRLGQSGLVSKATLFWMMAITFFVGFLLSLYLVYRGGWIIVGMYALAVLLGIFYTKGPINYAYKGLSEPIVLFFLGSIAVFFTTYLQTLQFSFYPLIVGLSPGFFSVALLGLNNLRDVEEDRLTKKNTLVVKYGERFGKIEITLALLAPFIITPSPLNICLIPLLSHILKKLWNDEDIPALLGKIGAAFILFTVLYILHAFFLWK
jgi:1,4-dihydroxy-2-naphthoate octaprenyltransferase